MTNASFGFRRRFWALRVESTVSNTISNRSVIAKPTTAACAPPPGDTEASTATRCERKN